jgi:hypothetical protein
VPNLCDSVTTASHPEQVFTAILFRFNGFLLVFLLQRLTVPMVDQLIADLKDCVEGVKGQPLGKGNMVTLYGTSYYL